MRTCCVRLFLMWVVVVDCEKYGVQVCLVVELAIVRRQENRRHDFV